MPAPPKCWQMKTRCDLDSLTSSPKLPSISRRCSVKKTQTHQTQTQVIDVIKSGRITHQGVRLAHSPKKSNVTSTKLFTSSCRYRLISSVFVPVPRNQLSEFSFTFNRGSEYASPIPLHKPPTIPAIIVHVNCNSLHLTIIFLIG